MHISLFYKFTTESKSGRILKIGKYLVKLWLRVWCLVFLDSRCRFPGVSCGVVCVIIIRLAVLVELRHVTDRQTDTDTDRHRPMASTADA